jgi:glycosyltransferase involved in cell wall biosynthesis
LKRRICWVFSAEASLRVFLLDHLSALSEQFDFTLVLPRSAVSTSPDGDLPARVIRLPIIRRPDVFKDTRALVSVVDILSRGGFDLVHSFMPKAGLLVSLARIAGFHGLRLHTFTGQVWLTRTGLVRAALKAVDRLISYASDVVIADSWSQRRFLAESGITRERNVVVLGQGSFTGVDLERFDVPAETRSAFRRELQIPEAERVVVFLGRVNRDKGVLELARAAADLVNKGWRFFLIIVGPDEEGLSSRIRDLCPALGERLLLPGLTNAPEKWLAVADLFCLPSFREGFGTSVIEAAAAGVPAVASRIPGLVDAVEDGETGLLVDPGDVRELSRAIAELLGDRVRTLAMGAAARVRAKELFSRQRSIGDWIGLYSRLLQNGSGESGARDDA